jgi:hypothetical protein
MRVVISLVVLCLGSAGALGQPRAVMVTGQPAPGTPSGVTFGITGGGQHMGVPIINNGTVAVFAAVTGPGVTASNMFGYWAVSPDFSVNLVARDGDVAPGTGGAVYSAVGGSEFPTSPMHVGLDGTLAFRGTLAVGGSVTTANNRGIWLGTPGSMQLLARTGDPAPGVAGAVYQTLGYSYIVPDGRVVHNGDLQGAGITTSNNGAFWISSLGNETLWVREGDVAPGTGGATWSLLGYHGTNSSGTGVFANNLTGGGHGIWSGTPGNMQLVYRTGSPAPGIAGATINSLNTPVILEDGRTVVQSNLATGSGGVTSANNSTLWIGTNDTDFQLLYREGSQVPVLAAGVNFGDFGTPPMARGNRVLFVNGITGTGVTAANNGAWFTWSASSGLSLAFREGDVAPGTGGALLGNPTFSPLNHGASPAITENGVVAWYTTLTGTGVNASNDTAIFLNDNGTIFLIGREGQTIDLDPGPGVDLATIANLSIVQHYFNNARFDTPLDGENQLAWLASFTDGRNAIMLSSVPEPSTYALVAVAASAVGFTSWRRRRKRR